MKRIPPENETEIIKRDEISLIILANQAMIMETLAVFMQNLVGDIERTHKIRSCVDATMKCLDKITGTSKQ